MQIFHGYEEVNQAFPCPILTIGNYDGLHLGHRQIIESVIKRARAQKGTSVVYTFRPHPHLALTPDEELQLINTYDEKLDLLAEIGVDVVVEQPFSRKFSTITPEKFFSDILVKRLSAHAIYVGYDFGFGKNRSGTLDMLRGFCQAEGVELHVAKPLKIDGEICSSSRIRAHLKAGDVTSANKLLGREFFYRGVVVRGNGRGHKIGFATANVKTDSKLRVKEGVYATLAKFKGEVFKSVTNVGRQPTFNKDSEVPVAVETHLFDFERDIYGEVLEVRMVERLRDEIRFDGVENLVKQIRTDVEAVRKILENIKC
ncbi:MAG: bifunctional riboflavin kinase/FAD synthetase [Deltaproteobacteria bacterium]|nr:bifunctional riboflavin kinase/FAD synthetase [Deltaproteobacteria bacterium]